MSSFNTNNALILVDFINEIVDPKGKLAGKGYADFDMRHNVLDRVTNLLEYARNNQFAVIHVGVGFSSDYKEQPENSPLFGGAKKFGALQISSWATEFHSKVAPTANESHIIKHRVSAFFGTSLDVLLRSFGVTNVFIAGCATDMAVQATARDAHDRDYLCTVVSDACIAASDDDHNQTIRLLAKVAKIATCSEVTAQ